MSRDPVVEQKNKRTPVEEQSSLRGATKEQKNKVPLFFSVVVPLFLCFLVSLFLSPAKAVAADFNPSNLISDGTFVNVNDMSEGDIQSFLEQKGSLLKDFSENGGRASKIIYEASHGHGDASGSYNGINVTETVNPKVILVMIQKEEGLIEGYYSRPENYSQTRLDWAMGYGYSPPDIQYQYQGFTKQIENAAWMMRYNYEKLRRGDCITVGYATPSCVRQGDTVTLRNRSWIENDYTTVTIDTKATAVLYRYTPYVYNGNYNFWYYFDRWFVQKAYEASWVSQSIYPTLSIGDSATLDVQFRNTGTETWYSSGAHPVILGLDKYWAARTAWQGPAWISENRMAVAQEGTVAPGEIGTFRFNVSCPAGMIPGRHRFYVRLVAEGLTWFDNPDTNGGAWWEINIPRPTAEYVGQSLYPTAWPGETVAMSVTFRNTQGVSWKNSSPPTNLAIDKHADENFLKKFRHSSWLSDYRIASLPQSEVANGATVTYNFNIKIPDDLSPGTYRFNVRLVQDGFSWFDNPDTNGGAWWEINVPKPTAEYISQSDYPTLYRGDAQVLWVKFRNTSGKTWSVADPHPVILGLDKYWAGRTAWQGPGWISENRMTTALEGDILSGGIGTYRFNIYVPTNMPSGKHRFYVRLVAEGFSWFDNPDTNGGAWWEITVL